MSEDKAEQFFMRIKVGEAQAEQDKYKSVDVIAVLCENARLAQEHQRVHEYNNSLLASRESWKHFARALENSNQILLDRNTKKEVIIRQQLCEITKLQNEISELSIKLKNANDTRN